MENLLKTPLHSYHEARAHLSEFAGYMMPLWYDGISAEHIAVRNSLGIFDISHMGRITVEGKNAIDLLNYVVPSEVSRLSVGNGLYSTLLNENAGIIDDIIIFRVGLEKYLLVVNAANLSKDREWLSSQNGTFSAEIRDITRSTAMVALQGPRAESFLSSFLSTSLSQIKRFSSSFSTIMDMGSMISRTGYTGEDGFEIIFFDLSRIIEVWEAMIAEGKSFGLMPCGLGARDTLRLEAGLCLYGKELNEEITPVEAALTWLISKSKSDYIGRERIMTEMERGTERVRVGLVMKEKGIPREGNKIKKRSAIGRVTSGTFSPLLKKGLAMGYVERDYGGEGEELSIEVRGEERQVIVKRPPFYDEAMYGWKRV